MEMPKPGPGHAQMEKLAGIWEGEERMHPSQWDPQGGTALGRRTGRLALNGFALVSDYEQERGGAVTFSGHGVLTFDAKRDLYLLHWFDCMGSPVERFEGPFRDGVLTLSHGGPGMHARLTYDLRKPGEMPTTMEMSPDGVKWNALFDALYKRL
jgi:hypothetical protein